MTRAGVDERVLREIKRIVMEEAGKLGIRVEKVILFGSRARGEAREDSDWDILVVVGGGASWKSLFKLRSRVVVRIYKSLGLEIDLIAVSSDWFESRRNMWGSIEREAAREGITV